MGTLHAGTHIFSVPSLLLWERSVASTGVHLTDVRLLLPSEFSAGISARDVSIINPAEPISGPNASVWMRC